MSDVHVEFFRWYFPRWLADRPQEPDVDLLILAGDVDVAAGLRGTLRAFCARWPMVVFVGGNHEYYGSSPAEIARIRETALAELPNLHWLDNEAQVIDGVRFVGGTLWYPEPPANKPDLCARMNDYHKIGGGFVPWVYGSNARCRALLQAKARDTDVVITHHIPATGLIAPQYAAHPLNHFFCDDQTALIAEAKPPVWVYGHTHSRSDVVLGSTRFVCNPKGYPDEIPGGYPTVTFEVVPKDA